MNIPTDLKTMVNYQEGAVVSREIVNQGGGTVTLFAFDVNQGLSEHTAPYDALVQIIEGEAQITIAGEAHETKEGQVLLMPAGSPHALKAKTRFKMLLTMIRSK
jgi:quercetin dioxygenase-like cupin family protein